jgi:hypothetical protein
MSIAQADQVFQAFTAKITPIFILGAILILVVGIPLYWFRLKLERALINRIRFARNRRHAEKFTGNMNVSADSSALSGLQCADGKETRAARRRRGFDILGLWQLSQVSRHASDLAH